LPLGPFKGKNMDILFLSVVLFVVLQILDIDSTKKVLSKGGHELNPVVDFFMRRFGINKGLYIIKFIVTMLIVYFYNIGQIDLTVLTILNLFYIVIVINNYRISKK